MRFHSFFHLANKLHSSQSNFIGTSKCSLAPKKNVSSGSQGKLVFWLAWLGFDSGLTSIWPADSHSLICDVLHFGLFGSLHLNLLPTYGKLCYLVKSISCSFDPSFDQKRIHSFQHVLLGWLFVRNLLYSEKNMHIRKYIHGHNFSYE